MQIGLYLEHQLDACSRPDPGAPGAPPFKVCLERNNPCGASRITACRAHTSGRAAAQAEACHCAASIGGGHHRQPHQLRPCAPGGPPGAAAALPVDAARDGHQGDAPTPPRGDWHSARLQLLLNTPDCARTIPGGSRPTVSSRPPRRPLPTPRRASCTRRCGRCRPAAGASAAGCWAASTTCPTPASTAPWPWAWWVTAAHAHFHLGFPSAQRCLSCMHIRHSNRHYTAPKCTVLLQGDLLSKFRREQLQAPPLWQLQHYHRCACGLFTLASHR